MSKKKGKRRGKHRRPQYRGAPLWKVVALLPDYGVGRLITRGSFKQTLEEPSYMRLLQVDYHKKARYKSGKYKIPALVQRIWRGVIYPKPVNIQSTSYLEDFILVPKADEARYIKYTKTPREKGYVYWNAEQRQNIRNLVAQGIPLPEAKEIEKARIFREEDAAAAQNGATSNQQQSMSFGPNLSGDIVYDNFDDDEDYGDDDGSDDSIDDNDNRNERKEIEVKRPEPVQRPTSILKSSQQNAKSALISNKGQSQQQNYPKPSVSALQLNQQSSTTTAKAKSVRFAPQQTVIRDQEPKRFDNKSDNRNFNFSAASSRNFQSTTQQNVINDQEPKRFDNKSDNRNFNFSAASSRNFQSTTQQNVIRDQEPNRFDNKSDNRNFSAASSRNFQSTTQQNATTHQDPKRFNIARNNINYDSVTAARSRHDHFALQQNFITHQEPKHFNIEWNNINYSTASSSNFHSIPQQNVAAHQSNYPKPSGSGLLLNQHTRTADTSRSIHFAPQQDITYQEPSCFDIEADNINYNNFTQEELQRIENMVKRGMIRETAAQMEWERQLAFQRAGF